MADIEPRQGGGDVTATCAGSGAPSLRRNGEKTMKRERKEQTATGAAVWANILDSAFDTLYISKKIKSRIVMAPVSLPRILTAIVVLFSMLFMQLAVASYVCPVMQLGSEGNAAPASAVMAEMPNCDGMDLALPTLCHTYAHGEHIKQSADKSSVPDVQPFVPVVLLLDGGIFDFAAAPDIQSPQPVALTRTTAPAIAIRHCCFRI